MMKTIILLTILTISTASFGTPTTMTCANEISKMTILWTDLSTGIQIDQKKSSLQHELMTLENMQTLSVNQTTLGWTAITLVGNNSDDTQMIATLILDSDLLTSRLSIQVLVDGIEGGTYSEAFECTIKKM